MYICLCNALTDRRLKQAVSEGVAETPQEVYAACGCRAQCGKCVRAVLAMLREPVPAPDGGLQIAD